MNFLRKAILTGLGSGYLRGGGTVASIIPCGVYLLLAWLVGQSQASGGIWALNASMIALMLFSSFACVLLGPFAEKTYGGKDPSQCTIDEVAGQSLALLAMPVGVPAWQSVIAAFVAFRLFDIAKPFPCRRLEKLPQGWGVLLDDLAAGIYGNILAQIVLHFAGAVLR